MSYSNYLQLRLSSKVNIIVYYNYLTFTKKIFFKIPTDFNNIEIIFVEISHSVEK